METPRRAAPSISGTREDDLDFLGEAIDQLGLTGRGGGLLAEAANVNSTGLLCELCAHPA